MEEKRYPQIEADEQVGMVSEPLSVIAYGSQTDSFQDRIPYTGPATWEEMIEEFEVSERQIEDGDGLPWESVKQIVANRISDHASSIH